MKFEFKKATKQKSKLRCAIFGPSGSGKTFTSLEIASGITSVDEKIALIDTERGRASKHSKRFNFDVLELTDYSVDSYIAAINAAIAYDVLIIDSLSHCWQKILEEVDKLAKTKYKNNSFRAWAEGTPLQKRLVNAILGFPGHIIATMRSKTEWVVESNDKGKSAPRRVGTTPEQGKGIEYEFDFIIEMNPDHVAEIWKGYDDFQDRIISKPTRVLGVEFVNWLEDGEDVPLITDDQLKRFNELVKNLNISDKKVQKGLEMKGFSSKEKMTFEIAEMWINSLEERQKSENKNINQEL